MLVSSSERTKSGNTCGPQGPVTQVPLNGSGLFVLSVESRTEERDSICWGAAQDCLLPYHARAEFIVSVGASAADSGAAPHDTRTCRMRVMIKQKINSDIRMSAHGRE